MKILADIFAHQISSFDQRDPYEFNVPAQIRMVFINMLFSAISIRVFS